MCLYTSIICNKCQAQLRNKKTASCAEVYDEHGENRQCAKVTYDLQQPFTKASKGDICAACRCKSEAEAKAEENDGCRE